MAVNFSASQNGFFHDAIKARYGANWPQDAKPVDDATYQDLLAAQDAGKQITSDSNGDPVAVDPVTLRSATNRRDASLAAIDQAAGRARERFVSAGALVDQEYAQAESEAQAFKDAGYSGTVPSSVQDWLDHNNKGLTTAKAAADDILATAQQWRGVINQIRGLRLAGKQAVRDAADADIETTGQSYIDQLDAITPA